MNKLLFAIIFAIAVYSVAKFFVATLAWTLGSGTILLALVVGAYLYFKNSKNSNKN